MSFKKCVRVPERLISLLNIRDLDEDEREVVLAAIRTRENSQSPYSSFRVGAAVQSVRGDIYSGCNVERCSYTQSTHAEQCAIDGMIAHEGPVGIRSLACYGAPKGIEFEAFKDEYDAVDGIALVNSTVKPCGHCRQIIWENSLGNFTTRIMCVCPNGLVMTTTIGALLPLPFGPADLGIDYTKL